MSAIPAEENCISFHLLSLLQTGKSYPVITRSVFAIKYSHKIVYYLDPCNSEMVNYVLEGIKRICCRSIAKKKSIIPQLLHTHYTEIYENYAEIL